MTAAGEKMDAKICESSKRVTNYLISRVAKSYSPALILMQDLFKIVQTLQG